MSTVERDGESRKVRKGEMKMSNLNRQANEMSLEELEMVVLRNSRTGDPDRSLMDWLAAGDLGGMTIQDVIDEWDEGR
jgi:hypothetical protein